MNQPATHHYLALPPRSLQTVPPEYHLPTLISTYSHLPDRSISHDDSSMAYYKPAPLGADLTYGFERRIERDENLDEHLDGLCEGLWEAHKAGKRVERRGGIITWRGMITRIMTAPFEDSEGWEMTAIPLDGSIYVELHDPPQLRSDRRKKQSAWALQSYMGMAYESYSTVPGSSSMKEESTNQEEQPEGWSGDVNTNIQWCNIVRSAIGDVPLCLGGEVDCVDEEPGTSHPGLNKCRELKTNKVIENEKGELIFHRKMLKHWAQSWLLGIPTVEVGFRDDDGILRARKTFETLKIPRFISSLHYPPWSPGPCHHFLYSFLNLVRTHVLPTDPTPAEGLPQNSPLPEAVVWRFNFVPRRGCELYRVKGGERGGEEGRWGGVLREDYVRWRMSRRSD